VLLNYIHSISK